MRLITYREETADIKTGVVLGSAVLDVSDWISRQPVSEYARERSEGSGRPVAAGGMLRLLQGGADTLRRLDAYAATRGAQEDAHCANLAAVHLYPPVPQPGKVIAIGRNYADHAKETGVTPFEKPRIVAKLSTCLAAPGAIVARPEAVSKMDFEAELAVVIGDYGHCVSEARALRLVAGYSVLNDLSAREFQFDVSPPQTTFAKSMDGFCPMGPWLATADEVGDPQTLTVSCWVNGVRKQHASTADMLFPVATLISYLSQFMTLEPGDVLATGTPAGIGAFRTPPEYLQPGDQLRLEVSRVGVLQHGIGCAQETLQRQTNHTKG